MEANIKLSTSEIGNLWTAYMNDSMAICVLHHFLQHIKDLEIKENVQVALQISEQHVRDIEVIFNKEHIAIPHGFNLQDDVNLKAPKLFSDTFCLYYVHNMAKIGGNSFTLALANSARDDIRHFFTKCGEKTMKLFNTCANTMLSKGLFLRPPQIEAPTKVDYVKKQNFLTGWLGERRPLTSIEIMNLFFNIERNQLGKSLITAFSQVAEKEEVVKYLLRGVEISSKHIEIFGSILSEGELPSPMTWDTLPTSSTARTFSDKLIMFHISALTAASVSHYGTSLGTSPRRDIGLHYNRLMHEVMFYAEDGANILIDHGWMEQPPQSVSRRGLAHRE
ncbi:DUF3231 family protein [Bacillus sp. FJAT-45350]|uniref:DUF3231 family protein n=1 Tax=Bacillus sp. FJAT-45350 TaxID=2011014 RepID=UPI00211B8DCF|nr:DUF3231 family protein [Bacillus sp. FJAT-45350]